MEPIMQLKQIIKESSNIVFFGGAGVSTESGIPDFRSASGLYSTACKSIVPPEEMVSHTFFIKHPEEFFSYYKGNLTYPDALPNKTHLTLAKLEEMGKLKAVITQNIDGLHQLAGSKNVLELHGSVHRNYCMGCGTIYELIHILNSPGVPRCSVCGGIVRPDVVLYEEGLDMDLFERAIGYISLAEVLIIGGTSLNVYPAAGLVNYYSGKSLVLINKTPTSYDNRADFVFRDSLGAVMEELV